MMPGLSGPRTLSNVGSQPEASPLPSSDHTVQIPLSWHLDISLRLFPSLYFRFVEILKYPNLDKPRIRKAKYNRVLVSAEKQMLGRKYE